MRHDKLVNESTKILLTLLREIAPRDAAEEVRIKDNPGGEEGEELRAALPSKHGYGNRPEGYKKTGSQTYAKTGEWTSPGDYRFSRSKTKNLIKKTERDEPIQLSKSAKITGMGSAEGASEVGLANRAKAHARGAETYGGLRKDDPAYHHAGRKAAAAGKLKPSIVAQTGTNSYAMVGGRTSARHHQLANVPVRATVISRTDVAKASDSAERHDAYVKSGKYDLRKKELASSVDAEGKPQKPRAMREHI